VRSTARAGDTVSATGGALTASAELGAIAASANALATANLTARSP
jgi:hypothetical protein